MRVEGFGYLDEQIHVHVRVPEGVPRELQKGGAREGFEVHPIRFEVVREIRFLEPGETRRMSGWDLGFRV